MERYGRAGLDSGGTWIIPMLILEIAGGLFVLLFIAAAMTGIEGAEHR
jgi:hypothetical protein